MGSKSENKPLDDLSALLSLAGQCDQAAATLGTSTKLLYDKIWEIKSRSGRGPNGVVVSSVLERVCGRYFAGSNILRTRRGPHPSATTFKAAVSSWIPALAERPVLQPMSPPSAEKAA
jgi:hypothetical protein